MNFSSILEAVKEGWSFVWPPCVLAVLLAGLFRLLAPQTSTDCETGSKKLFGRRRRLIVFLRLYGLGKFLPAIDAFAILLILYLLQQLPPAIGNVLPGQFVFDDTALWAQRSETMVCALAAVPGATLDNLGQGIRVRERAVEAKLGAGTGNELFNAEWAEKELDATIRLFKLCKFVILYSLVLAGIEIFRTKKLRHSVLFLLPVLAVLLICAAYLVERVAYQREQQQYQLMDDLEVIEQIDGFSCSKVPKEQTEDIYRTLLLARSESRGRNATQVEFVSYYYKWLKGRFTPQQKTVAAKSLLEPESAESLFAPDLIYSAEKKSSSSWGELLPESKKGLDQTVNRLVEMDYFLPSMIDRENPETGSILLSHGSGMPLHYFVPSWTVAASGKILFPAPTSLQSALCPAGYHPRLQQFDSSIAISADEVNLLWQVEGRFPLIVTEQLSCAPDDPAHAQEFVLGYKIAKVD